MKRKVSCLSIVLGWMKKGLRFLFLFLVCPMRDKRSAAIRKEAYDASDVLMLVFYADTIGIPYPMAFEALPFTPETAEELPYWRRRIRNRRSVVFEKAGVADVI
jgi:hypothetical protein